MRCDVQDASLARVFGGSHPLPEGYAGPGREQDDCIENFDWSRLRGLEVNDASLAPGLISKLQNL